MATQHIEHMLQALQYPLKGSFDVTNKALYQEVIHELEDKYVAALEPAERGMLEPTTDNRRWNNSFRKYLGELGCPIGFKASHNEGPVLEWLLQLAIADEYDATAQPAAKETNGSQSFQDFQSADTKRLVKDVQQVLGINSSSMNLTKQLQDIKSGVETQAQAADVAYRGDADAGIDILSKHSGNLGFTSNDDMIDKAATLMRILYINDLRVLQSQIDDAIVGVQEFTQNPRANAKLGVVGR